MATKQPDEYLKTALGVDLARHRAAAPAVAKPAPPTKQETPAAKSAAPPAKPPPEDLDEPPAPARPPASDATDAPKPKLPDGMAMVQPQDLVKLRAGLASIAREIKDGLARQKEIEGEAKKAHVDLKKTDAVAKAGARFGAAVTDKERGDFDKVLRDVKKSRENIQELFDQAHQAKKQLDIFRKLKLEGVSDQEQDERGKQAANIFDTVVNSLKAVLDLVTGDLVQFPSRSRLKPVLKSSAATASRTGLKRVSNASRWSRTISWTGSTTR